MQSLKVRLDEHLTDLAWSFWTELGVRGIQRKHQQYLIIPEELILLTAVIGEADPRLRGEVLDWCSRYHPFISVSRLRTLAKAFGDSVTDSFSLFSATLNSISQANWPVFKSMSPLKFKPSGKSKLPEFESPALLLFRLRALFGVGSRADLLAFFLAQEEGDYAISDTVEIGYSKRNLASMLEGFAKSGIFEVSFQRNQQRYQFTKRKEFMKILGPLPKNMFSWRHFLEVVLKLRDCIRRNEQNSEDTKVIELRNTLIDIENPLYRLNLEPPLMRSDFSTYWDAFASWLLKELHALAQGLQ